MRVTNNLALFMEIRSSLPHRLHWKASSCCRTLLPFSCPDRTCRAVNFNHGLVQHTVVMKAQVIAQPSTNNAFHDLRLFSALVSQTSTGTCKVLPCAGTGHRSWDSGCRKADTACELRGLLGRQRRLLCRFCAGWPVSRSQGCRQIRMPQVMVEAILRISMLGASSGKIVMPDRGNAKSYIH